MKQSIPFNVPCVTGKEHAYIRQALKCRKLSGDGAFNKRCQERLEKTLPCPRALLVSSGTHALDMAAMLIDIKPGDEVIMPSFTFSSTANAFALRGARIVFVDIRPDTMNIDEKLIEPAITAKTKAIVPVHYAGVACEMDEILRVARRHGLKVIEDAAQGIYASYRGRPLGAIGDIGCVSFHETKNITCGEGGAILVNNPRFMERAEIIREKGTDRSRFFRGEVDKYSWVDIGSSYLLSELSAACLLAQLESGRAITRDRLLSCQRYRIALEPLRKAGCIEFQHIPSECAPNGHLFYIKTSGRRETARLLEHMHAKGILAIFHYIPLHSAKAGKRFGRFSGEDRHTTRESERLVRLPLFYGMSRKTIDRVASAIAAFYGR